MNIKKLIKENVIDANNFSSFKACEGVIEEINYRDKVARVSVKNQHGEGLVNIKAKLQLQSSSVKFSVLKKGDRVNVSFDGDRLVGAKITSMCSSRKSLDELHLFSNICLDTKDNLGESLNIKELTMGEALSNEVIYNTDFNEFINQTEVRLSLYREDEVAISSPLTNSVIKIDEEGNVIIGAGLLASIVVRKDGVIELNSDEITYKR